MMEKPEWISWDEIQQCIHDAHLTNNKKGFHQSTGNMTGDELKSKVCNGFCFVVLDESNKVIGTMSLIVSKVGFWWYKGMAGYHCYEGVLPAYRGTDVYTEMHKAVIKKEKELGLKLKWATTAESNIIVQKLSQRDGWKKIQYTPNGKGCDYYSVILAKWMDGCPYSDRTINFMFYLSRFVIRFLYKPGKIRRFKLRIISKN